MPAALTTPRPTTTLSLVPSTADRVAPRRPVTLAPADGPQLRVVPSTPTDPPYDDELTQPELLLWSAPAGAPAGAPTGAPAGAPTGAPTGAGTSGTAGTWLQPTLPTSHLSLLPVSDDDVDFGPQPTRRQQLRAPGPVATSYVRAVLEVLSGDRPLRQLTKAIAPALLLRFEEQLPRRQGRPWAASLRSVRVTEPSDGVAEVTAVIRQGERCSALALRMEGIDGRWVITRFVVGF